MESDGDKVVKEVIFGPGGKKYRFCKHISKQRLPGLPIDLMKKGKHFILIRNPLDILVRDHPILDALLSDICIATFAAPTFFPAYSFKNQDSDGKVEEFNVIDGGMAANNPTLVAISEVTKQTMKKNPDFFPIKPMDYNHFLVISLGTGSRTDGGKYNAKLASKWGVISWLYYKGGTPLIDCYSKASGDMVDYHNSIVFQALHSEQNYLQIDALLLSQLLTSRFLFLDHSLLWEGQSLFMEILMILARITYHFFHWKKGTPFADD